MICLFSRRLLFVSCSLSPHDSLSFFSNNPHGLSNPQSTNTPPILPLLHDALINSSWPAMMHTSCADFIKMPSQQALPPAHCGGAHLHRDYARSNSVLPRSRSRKHNPRTRSTRHNVSPCPLALCSFGHATVRALPRKKRFWQSQFPAAETSGWLD